MDLAKGEALKVDVGSDSKIGIFAASEDQIAAKPQLKVGLRPEGPRRAFWCDGHISLRTDAGGPNGEASVELRIGVGSANNQQRSTHEKKCCQELRRRTHARR